MRGNITKRGRNSWQLKFDAPAIDGKRQQRYATVRGSYQDAKKELTRLLAAVDNGTLPKPSAMTVGEYLKVWLDTTHNLSPKTRERYGELADRQITPHLGAHKLQKLRPEHLQAWHSELLKTLAPRTVGHAHRLLSGVLKYAVENATLARNVANVIKPPKAEDGEIEILEADQIAAVLTALQGHSLYLSLPSRLALE